MPSPRQRVARPQTPSILDNPRLRERRAGLLLHHGTMPAAFTEALIGQPTEQQT